MLHHIEDIWTPSWFREELTEKLAAALTEARTEAARESRRAHRETLQARVPEARVDDHRLEATETIEVADWFSDAPLVEGESNRPLVPEDRLSENLVHPAVWATERELYRWLRRDDAKHRVRWSEQDERELVLGQLRHQVAEAARKHRCTRRDAVIRFPAAKAAMQQALAIKARWNFQQEVVRVTWQTPSKEHTSAWKAAFGRTYATASIELRSAREASQRQPFAAVKAGLV